MISLASMEAFPGINRRPLPGKAAVIADIIWRRKLTRSRHVSLVHSVRVANDGMVYVADRENRRVQSFTVAGAFVKQLVKGDTPFARSVALSPDSEQKFLYVGNGSSIAILDRKSLELIGQIKPPGAIGGGHLIGTDPKGNIYVAATTGGMQKLTYKGTTTRRSADDINA
jgi:ribosomal protein S11